MSIPDLPVFFDMKYTTVDGELTSEAFLYNDSMFQTLDDAVFIINNIVNTSVSSDGTVTNNGLTIPIKSPAEIATLIANIGIPLGTLWYNSNTNKLNFKDGAGTVQAVTSTP